MHQQYIQPYQPVLVLSNNTAMLFRQKGKYSSLWLNMFFQAEFDITIDEVLNKLALVENANDFGYFAKSIVLHNWRNILFFIIGGIKETSPLAHIRHIFSRELKKMLRRIVLFISAYQKAKARLSILETHSNN